MEPQGATTEPSSRRAWIGALVGLAALAHHPSVRAVDTKATAIALAALVVVALRTPRWFRRPGRSPALGALSLIIGLLAVSLAWSVHPAPLALAPWVAALALASATTRDEARDHASIAAAIILIGSAALLAIGVPHGGHGNPNWLGLTAAIALPIVIDRARSPEGRAIFVLASIAGVALSVAGASRAALVGLVAAAIWAAPGRFKLAAAAPLALLGVFADRARDALGGRFTLFGDAWNAVRWPHGVGLGSFHRAFLEAQGARLADLPPAEAAQRFVNAETAHHDLLQLLVEAGPLAALSFVALLSLGLFSLPRWRGGAAAVVVLAVAGLGDSALALPPVVALLGLVIAACPGPKSSRSWIDRLPALAAILALAALLPRLTMGWLAQRGLADVQKSGAPSLAALEELAAVAPHDAEIALALGIALLDEGEPEDGLAAIERARTSSTSVGIELSLGRAHLVLDDVPRAVAAFERALRFHPASFRALLGLAEAHRRAQAFAAAHAALDEARAIRPHDPRLRRLSENLRRDEIEAATR
jgi:tetratricopeptide (TPR) repeat protein